MTSIRTPAATESARTPAEVGQDVCDVLRLHGDQRIDVGSDLGRGADALVPRAKLGSSCTIKFDDGQLLRVCPSCRQDAPKQGLPHLSSADDLQLHGAEASHPGPNNAQHSAGQRSTVRNFSRIAFQYI